MHTKTLTDEQLASGLINHDLAPVPQSGRTWTTLNYLALWVGMSVCIPTYMIASSLIQGGMNVGQAVLTVFLGNLIVLIPMILNGHVGVQYGIPFPIFARASFGVKGSNIPALLRAVVACGWFGIQTWIGGSTLYVILKIFWPAADSFPTVLPAFMGVSLIPFLCFMVFWAINVFLMWKGIECIKRLETYCAPFLILCGLALLYWAYVNANGFGGMLHAESKFKTSAEFLAFFFPALTGMVGYWATLSLNIPDFTRYARDQRSQMIGQALGLPTTMTLFAFIGVAVTSATVVIYGESIWDPVVLIGKFGNPALIIFAMLVICLATLTMNVAANVVAPANDFANLAPHKIDFKKGGYITAVLGILMMPWKLLADPSGYIFTWLIGYSALLGPVAGILLTDYFILRHCKLKVDDLYRHEGLYAYGNGYNIRAVVALIVGILPNIPGFLVQIKAIDAGSVPDMLTGIYHYAWFVGLFLAGAVYYLLMRNQVNKAVLEENTAMGGISC
jgi:nucleobase:cation symporter-1, NCS1 family